MAQAREVVLEVKDMCKNFGETIALNHVDLFIRAGEIRGLIGENGSGKSTVSSIISGMQPATSGSMKFHGKPWNPTSVLYGMNHGIGMVVQEAGTLGNITVAENLFLGEYRRFKKFGIINKAAMEAAAVQAMEHIGLKGINPAWPVRRLDMQSRKLLELARIMEHKPEILIIDETTTALGQSGREILYSVMHKVADEGKSVLIISHDLDEMMEQCDTLTVLRDGKIIENLDKEDFEPGKIKKLMVGREVADNFYRSDNDGYSEEVVLRADKITTLKDLLCFSMELHKGEILGIGGLSDCGMHRLGHALFGLEEILDGEVILEQKNVRITSSEKAFNSGMGYISKDRDNESLEQSASIGANIASTGYEVNRVFQFLISGKRENAYIQKQIRSLSIKCRDQHQLVKELSGGNKQKVVFGKWIAYDADILIMDCPTRGVDIGVKAAMYQLIYEMKKAGKSIVMISEEMPELMGMCDRLLIMKDGEINGEFFRKDGFSEHEIIECMI